MANFKLQTGGTTLGGHSDHDVLRALARQQARVVSGAITNLTNNSGGTAATAILAHTTMVNAANSGTSLAQKAASETAIATVLDGYSELLAKANATATALGMSTITDSSGATTADGTLGAITVSVTAATTGAQAAATNTLFDAIDGFQYNVAALINKLAVAVGVTPAVISYIGTPVATVAAITNSTGTAADPGITKAAMDAELVLYRSYIKYLANVLDSVNTAAVPEVLVV